MNYTGFYKQPRWLVWNFDLWGPNVETPKASEFVDIVKPIPAATQSSNQRGLTIKLFRFCFIRTGTWNWLLLSPVLEQIMFLTGVPLHQRPLQTLYILKSYWSGTAPSTGKSCEEKVRRCYRSYYMYWLAAQDRWGSTTKPSVTSGV